jgi:hypothetical protein
MWSPVPFRTMAAQAVVPVYFLGAGSALLGTMTWKPSSSPGFNSSPVNARMSQIGHSHRRR